MHLDTPFREYPDEIKDVIDQWNTVEKNVKVHYKGQRGEGVYDVAFEGLIKNVERRYRETGSETYESRNMNSLCRSRRVKTCQGQRLKTESLAVTVGDKNIYEVTAHVGEESSGRLWIRLEAHRAAAV